MEGRYLIWKTCGAIVLIILSCWPAMAQDQPDYDRAIEATRIQLAHPRVDVAISCRDLPLRGEIQDYLVQALNRIKGVAVTSANPDYIVNVVAVPELRGKRYALSVVVEGQNRRLLDHQILTGPYEDLRRACDTVATDFEVKFVAPFR